MEENAIIKNMKLLKIATSGVYGAGVVLLGILSYIVLADFLNLYATTYTKVKINLKC